VYSSAEEFLAAYRTGAALCLILDVRLRGMSGLDLQQELKRRGEALPLIFVSSHGGIPVAVDAMKNGAVNFLEKPCPDAELVAAIETARMLAAKDRGLRADK
jgi:FixJ family two-component response regulator